MAEMVSDSVGDVSVTVSDPPKQHPPKRRRVIDASSITSVPIYSNKVNSSLNLRPITFQITSLTEEEKGGPHWSLSPPRAKKRPITIDLSSSEEEPEQSEVQEILRSPSPPPPPPHSQPVKQSRRVNQKIQEINKKLNAISSLMSLSPEPREPVNDYDDNNDDVDDDDDIVIISSDSKQKRRPLNTEGRNSAREISLKFRCRTELYKIPILSTAPLSKAVEQLAIKLNVTSSQILLLKNDMDLPTHSSASELGLGIVDIIDCVVTENKQEVSDTRNLITVRLQGREKASVQEYSLQKNAPLGSILSQYVSGLAASDRRRTKFLFDGSRVKHNQTPADLDMEDGDLIEVWA